jgi:hypothetical protein
MPWYRDGHSVPVVYKGRSSALWWVDYSYDADPRPFETWLEAIKFALTTLHSYADRHTTNQTGDEK